MLVRTETFRKSQAAVADVTVINVQNVPAQSSATDSDWDIVHSNLNASVDKLLVGIVFRQTTSAFSSITYGGNAPTGSSTQTILDLSTDFVAQWFWWDEAALPAAGSNKALVVTFSNTAVRGGACIIPLIGAAQGTPTTQGATVLTNTVISNAGITAAGGSFGAFACMAGDGDNSFGTPTIDGVNATEIGDDDEPLNDDRTHFAYLTGLSGSIVCTATFGVTEQMVLQAIVVDPA